ncbi:hypothetical protein BDV09DRAFT_130543 [Aspergillus tetrazonus]
MKHKYSMTSAGLQVLPALANRWSQVQTIQRLRARLSLLNPSPGPLQSNHTKQFDPWPRNRSDYNQPVETKLSRLVIQIPN